MDWVFYLEEMRANKWYPEFFVISSSSSFFAVDIDELEMPNCCYLNFPGDTFPKERGTAEICITCCQCLRNIAEISETLPNELVIN